MTGGFFVILDDIGSLMNNTVTMTKVATKNTVGILGDDLAVNAEKASGFSASRELPVLWAITKGSFINKLIILPIIFLLNFYAPQFIIPILFLGATYLAYEGYEKILEWIPGHHSQNFENVRINEVDKIKSAIKTDFILSFEIVVIALYSVIETSLQIQMFIVSIVSMMATVFVYGIVALLVRMDDIGFYLIKRGKKRVGQLLVESLPKLISFIAVVGTLAMFMVAGGILEHNIPQIHEMHLNLGYKVILGAGLGILAYYPIHIFFKIKDKYLLKERQEKS